MEMPPKGAIPLADAARTVGLSDSHLRALAIEGRLKAVKWRREWWVRLADVRAYLKGRAPQGRRGEGERKAKGDAK